VDREGALGFVREHHRAVLATLRRDGSPQLTPVAAAVDDAERVVISTREPAMKTRNLRRDPRAWLCVLLEDFYPRGGGPAFVQLAGTAEVLSLPEAMEPLVDYYRRVSGEHPDWAAYRAAMRDERRCLLRIAVAEVGPGVAG
jgi:PPOX class probable F420-dependent enzyme